MEREDTFELEEIETAPLLAGKAKTKKRNITAQLELDEKTRAKLDAAEARRNYDKKKQRNFLAFLGISIIEILNFCVIFLMNSSNAFLAILLSPPMRFISFPIAAIAGLVKAGFNWRSFHLTLKDKRSTKEDKVIGFLQALWDTLNGLGTTGAVITGIIGFFIGASVGAGISITFNFFLAASTVICAAYSCYYAITARRAYKEWEKECPEKNDKQHPKYLDFKNRREKALDFGLITGFVTLLTVGVAVAMVAGILTGGAAIGVAGCLLGAIFSAYCIYKVVKAHKASKNDKKLLENMPLKPSSVTINERMGLKRTNSCNDLRDSVILKNQILSPEEKAAAKRQSITSSLEKANLKKRSNVVIDLTQVKAATFNKFKNAAPSSPSLQEGLRHRKPFALAQ